MFENAQEESGSGAAKIVGGVVAVVAVLLVVVYFAFLREAPATGGGKSAGASAAASAADAGPADPMKDLSITKSDMHRDQATQTMAMWDIVVTNHSKSHAYKDIKYSTNYYNAQDAVVYHNEGTLNETVDPGDQHTFSQINDGLYQVGTVRFTIELKGATPAQ